MRRAHNFSAGPAAVPTEILEQARDELLDWHGTGMSILEMSHRDAGGPVQSVMAHAERRLRELLSIPARYRVLFLHGGAHGQFAGVPLNLAGSDAVGSYVRTGFWSTRAQLEAAPFIPTEIAADAEALGGTRLPPPSSWQVSPNSAYVHFCANETIHGLEFHEDPHWEGPPLVADFTSTLLSRPVDIERYGVIYASSGKNLGPAGVTVVIVREDLLERATVHPIPSILDWKKAAQSTPLGSLYNTPPVFAIYFLGLVLDGLAARGGLRAVQSHAKARADRLYAILDAHPTIYSNAIDPSARSRMNLPFRVRGGDPESERRFTAEAEARGLHQLFGHPLFGGQRITLYNGVRDASVDALAAFLEDFART